MTDYMVMDLETSGFSTDSCIVQVGWCSVRGGEKNSGQLCLKMPDWAQMSAEAEKVHGLSRDYLERHGRDPAEVLPVFREMLVNSNKLVGHNIINFDLPRLNEAFKRYDIPAYEDYEKVCDTGMVYKAYRLKRKRRHNQTHYAFYRSIGSVRARIKWNLDACCAEFGVELTRDQHDAGEDCLMTAMLYEKLLATNILEEVQCL